MSKIKFAELPKIKYVVEVTIATYFNKTMGHTSSSARVVINRDYNNVKLFPIQPGNERTMLYAIKRFLEEQGILQSDQWLGLESGILYNEHVVTTTRRNCTALGNGLAYTVTNV